MPTLKINRQEHAIWARISRPEAHNAIDEQVMDELEQLLDEVENNTDVRVLILSGDGQDYFVAGGDLKKFHSIETSEQAARMGERMNAILTRIEQGDFWSIACINGDAYGGGCEMILAFDMSIASKTAVFGFTQARFYLPPGWGGLTRLVERVGRSRALELLGSQAVIGADKAYEYGFINRLSVTADLPQNTWKWAEKLAKNDRDLICRLKQGSREAQIQPREEAIKNEIRSFGDFWEHQEHFNRVSRFLNQKKG